MTPPKIDLAGGGVRLTYTWNDFRIQDVGQCRLLDYATLAPAGNLSDPQLKLSTHLVGCVWGQKGSIWLEQSLTLGGELRLHSGAGASIQLNNALYVHVWKSLSIDFTFLMTGTFDSHTGWNGSYKFNGVMKGITTQGALPGLGISVPF